MDLMEFALRTFERLEALLMKNTYTSKIVPKINNFVNVPMNDTIDAISEFFTKFSVVSVDIHDIFHNRKNPMESWIIVFNCACMWIGLIISQLTLHVNLLLDLLRNDFINLNQMKLLLNLGSILLLVVAILKTDLLIEERKNNLAKFKFLYYLMVDDRAQHKLNKHNYKMFKFITGIIHLVLIRFGFPFVIICGTFGESKWSSFH